MNDIVRPLTADGTVGHDQFGQLVYKRQEGEYTLVSIIGDVRDTVCSICNQGWEPTGPSLSDQHFWHSFREWIHLSCLIRFSALQDRSEFFHAMVRARVRFHFKTIPNGYWPEKLPESKAPWYQFDLLDHPGTFFIIGARKRVIQMEIHPPEDGTLTWHKQAERDFSSEDVTKSFEPHLVMVHAWGPDKLKEYLRNLVEIGGYKKPGLG